MNNVTLVEVVKPFEYFDNIASNKAFIQFAKSFECLSKRPILCISGEGFSNKKVSLIMI